MQQFVPFVVYDDGCALRVASGRKHERSVK